MNPAEPLTPDEIARRTHAADLRLQAACKHAKQALGEKVPGTPESLYLGAMRTAQDSADRSNTHVYFWMNQLAEGFFRMGDNT